MEDILIFFVALILTLISVPYLIDFLTIAEIVDYPDGRRINKSPIPRMGGVVVYVLVLMSLLLFFKGINKDWLIIVSSLCVFTCGSLDDIVGLKWSYKFAMQSAAAAGLLLFIFPGITSTELFGIRFFYPLDIIVLGLFMVGVMNAVNLMDGLDGLVSGFSIQVMLIVLTLAILYSDSFVLMLSFALLGSLLGFLRYNAYPARIFLGDTGSMILGFFLLVSLLMVSHDVSATNLDLTFPVIVLGVPIVDTIKVMFIRIIHGNNPFLPDQNHLHHVIINSNVRHKTTVAIILSLTGLFAALAVMYLRYSKTAAELLFVLLAVVLWQMRPILLRLSKVNLYGSLKGKAVTFVLRHAGHPEVIFLPLSIPLIAAYAIVSLPSFSGINIGLLLIALLLGVLFMAVTLLRNMFGQGITDIYVLINIVIFGIYTSHSVPFLHALNISDHLIVIIKYVSLLGIAISFLFLISKRARKTAKSRALLSGLDLLIIVSVISAYLISAVVNPDQMSIWHVNIIEICVLYLWYKVAIYINEKVSVYILYASFTLPILVVSLMFLMSGLH